MFIRSLTALVIGVGTLFLVAEASALSRVTTDSCLAKGQCAYVSPKGRVTCGPCPGQKAVLWRRSARPVLCTASRPSGMRAATCTAPARR